MLIECLFVSAQYFMVLGVRIKKKRPSPQPSPASGRGRSCRPHHAIEVRIWTQENIIHNFLNSKAGITILF